MSWVDVLVVVLAIVAGISGWRHGMAVALLSFVGVLGGAILGVQLAPLLASKAYAYDGMIVVTFDTGPDFTKPLGALLISGAVEAGGTDEGDYRPANLLRTFEDVFALDPLGRAKDVHAVAITKPSR